ncbi:hypothetical protein [Tenuibacillus multivorans]|uniref:hypothetical protein n=1 Tax=Tenuibacillus multivorans TaxID=237069 RepID=UPI000B887CA6|nr:hypothetical protein [Tenuibacillus multivorans]GEL77401.1 hypothetical protein TMU01_16360 [Tenuibacillus multivorans]
MKRTIIILSILLIASACSTISDDEKDILYIRKNPDGFQAKTIPYQGNIVFTLKTDEILNGINEPQKITRIEDTEVYLTELREKENEIFVIIEFDGNFNPEGGTMLSLFRLSDNNSHANTVTLQSYNDNGERIGFVRGSGDGGKLYGQQVHYRLIMDKLVKSDEWTFEISDMHLLNYSKS